MEEKIYNRGKNGDWIVLSKNEESTTHLVFQQIESYKKLTLPKNSSKHQQMIHLDFYSDNEDESVQHAIVCNESIFAEY